MLVVRTVADLRAQVSALRRQGKTVALVPTMGALHAGHLELIRQAGDDCDAVVLSIFVNPAQFDDTADLAAYPRTEQPDLELATAAGWTWPLSPLSPRCIPLVSRPVWPCMARSWKRSRAPNGAVAISPGVTTVVSKLFNMVGADRAYFGQKDAQQLHVVRAMVTDLNIDIDIVSVPTVREPDGMALSSRNVRLSPCRPQPGRRAQPRAARRPRRIPDRHPQCRGPAVDRGQGPRLGRNCAGISCGGGRVDFHSGGSRRRGGVDTSRRPNRCRPTDRQRRTPARVKFSRPIEFPQQNWWAGISGIPRAS